MLLRLIECGPQFRQTSNFHKCVKQQMQTKVPLPTTLWSPRHRDLVTISSQRRLYKNVGWVISQEVPVAQAFPFDACTRFPSPRRKCIASPRDFVTHWIRTFAKACNSTSVAPLCQASCYYENVSDALWVQDKVWERNLSCTIGGVKQCHAAWGKWNQLQVAWNKSDIEAVFFRSSAARDDAIAAARIANVSRIIDLDTLES